jgi:uncharacterized membrane protein YfcA
LSAVVVRWSLLGALLIVALAFVAFVVFMTTRTTYGGDADQAPREAEPPRSRWPSWLQVGVGFVTDFLDTLGIGSYATTTSLFRAFKLVPDRCVPGTLNVGHALPTVLQAFIYISVIEVDVLTLVAMIGAAVLGAHFGARWVTHWSERSVRLAVGGALIVAALLMLGSMNGFLPVGGVALGLRGVPLAVGVLGNLLLGSLMTFGIGLYGPCMVLVALLGMNPRAAFPIMMGSCAFLMPVAAPQFVRGASYEPRAALGLTLGGLPAVWIAAKVVRELDLSRLRFVVLFVVLYTAFATLRAAWRAPARS